MANEASPSQRAVKAINSWIRFVDPVDIDDILADRMAGLLDDRMARRMEAQDRAAYGDDEVNP